MSKSKERSIDKAFWNKVHKRGEKKYGEGTWRAMMIYGSLGWDSYLREKDEEEREESKRVSRGKQ